MKSLTVEDIFYVHERNRLIYYDCEKQGCIDKCPNNLLQVCCCKNYCPVYPDIISNDYKINHNKTKKIYIKPGEICPICYDPIINKKNAFLTPCGHSFHKTCLNQTHTSNLLRFGSKNEEKMPCPMCRKTIHVENFYDPLKIFFYKKNPSEFDIFDAGEICKNTDFCKLVDNFWEKGELNSPQICLSRNMGPHFFGMKKNCTQCIIFQKGSMDTGNNYSDTESTVSSDDENNFWETDSDEDLNGNPVGDSVYETLDY
jgi:hypothetical protein